MTNPVAAAGFVETHRYRPFELVADCSVDVEIEQPRGIESGGLQITDAAPAAPFAAVELRLSPGAGSVVRAGLAAPSDGDFVVATYEPAVGRVTIDQRTGGRTRTVAISSSRPGATGLAFVLCENQATALLDAGDGWQPVTTARRNLAAFADYRDPRELARLRYAYGMAGGTSAPIASVRAGLFGCVGVRDPHVVQMADGSPYVKDGKLYLTMTCAGLGFFQQAHWGVFTLDLTDLDHLEQIGHIFASRDGLVLGDHAGQIVIDGDTVIVAVSAWGDFTPGSVHVRSTRTNLDVLSAVTLLETHPMRLPTQLATWDPALTRIDRRWYAGFVASPAQTDRFDFHPALAVGPEGAAYDQDLALVGADAGLHQCEGPILTWLANGVVAADADADALPSGSAWRLLASDADAGEYPVYDLQVRRIGTLRAPYGTNIPHPQVVTVPGPDGGRQLLITFDGTAYGESVLGYGTHGDLVICQTPSA
jgi:hypothetical protein